MLHKCKRSQQNNNSSGRKINIQQRWWGILAGFFIDVEPWTMWCSKISTVTEIWPENEFQMMDQGIKVIQENTKAKEEEKEVYDVYIAVVGKVSSTSSTSSTSKNSRRILPGRCFRQQGFRFAGLPLWRCPCVTSACGGGRSGYGGAVLIKP